MMVVTGMIRKDHWGRDRLIEITGVEITEVEIALWVIGTQEGN